jgi:hypothetical protein
MNKMTIGDVLSFLRPDGEVSEVAGFVIVVLTGIGVALCHRTRRDLARRPMDPEVYAATSPSDFEGELSSASTRFAEALPSIVILVGLIFTFAGLGTAIHEAARQGAGGDPNQLLRVLEPLGYKFQTSVWAILASLVVRAFVSRWIIAPRAALASTLYRALLQEERARQEQTVHGAVRSLADAWRELGVQASERETTRHAEVTQALAPIGQFAVIANALNDVARAQANTATELKTSASGLATAVNNLARDQSDAHKKLTGAIDAMKTEVGKVLSNVGKDFGEIVGQTKKAVGDLDTSLDNRLNVLGQMLGSMREDNERTAGLWQRTLSNSAELLRTTQGEFQTKLKDALLGIENSLGGAAGEIKTAVGESQNSLKGLLDDIGKAIGSMTEEVQRLKTVSEAQASRMGAVKNEMELVRTEVATVAESAARLRSDTIEINTLKAAEGIEAQRQLLDRMQRATVATARRVKPLESELQGVRASSQDAARAGNEIRGLLQTLGIDAARIRHDVAALPLREVQRSSDAAAASLGTIETELTRVAGALPTIEGAIRGIGPSGVEQSIRSLHQDLVRDLGPLVSLDPLRKASAERTEHLGEIRQHVNEAVSVLHRMAETPAAVDQTTMAIGPSVDEPTPAGGDV